MTKKIATFVIVISLILIFPFGVFAQNPGDLVTIGKPSSPSVQTGLNENTSYFWNGIAKGMGGALMGISSGFLSLTGFVFDGVVKFSVIGMGENLGEKGMGPSIRSSWVVLRDIANIGFIFVLIFTAFKAMFELNFGNINKSISNIIIAALLINFSLFFAKIPIDAANVVSTGFYQSITSAGPTSNVSERTVSRSYMNLLGLQTWYKPDSFLGANNANVRSATSILTIGVMGSIFFLVTAVIFLITSVMFAARFIILIFLLILSPLAVIAFIIPGQSGLFKKWFDSLIAQSFFAPLFFALTWVSLKMAAGVRDAFSNATPLQNNDFLTATMIDPSGSVSLIINFIVVIGLSIAALVFSKQMASTAVGFSAINKFASGAVVGGAISAAGWTGRNVVGRGANMLSNAGWLKESASKGGVRGFMAKNALKASVGTAKSSFDLRASDTLKKIPGLGKELGDLGKAGGKDGFRGSVAAKAKAEKEFAKDYLGQTRKESEMATSYEKEVNELKNRESEKDYIRENRQKAVDNSEKIKEKAEKDRNEYLDSKLKDKNDAYVNAQAETQEKKKKLEEQKKISGDSSPQVFQMEKEFKEAEAREREEKKKYDEAKKSFIETDEEYKNFDREVQRASSKVKEAKDTLNKKEVGDNEYTQETREKMAEMLKYKNAGKTRQQRYAETVSTKAPVSTGAGAVIGGAIGGAVGMVFGPGTAMVMGSAGAAAGAKAGSWLGGKFKTEENIQMEKAVREVADGKDKKDAKKATDDLVKALKDSKVIDDDTTTPESGTGSTGQNTDGNQPKK